MNISFDADWSYCSYKKKTTQIHCEMHLKILNRNLQKESDSILISILVEIRIRCTSFADKYRKNADKENKKTNHIYLF